MTSLKLFFSSYSSYETSNCISIFYVFSFCRIMEELLCLELFCEMQIVSMYMVYAVCFLEVVHLTVTVLFDK